jgi:hypothetical protein
MENVDLMRRRSKVKTELNKNGIERIRFNRKLYNNV